jgi:hypothetical protein
MPRPDPPPERTSYATWWSYRQARKAWIRRHGGSILWPLAIAGFIGLASGNAAVLLGLLTVAIVGMAWARSRW